MEMEAETELSIRQTSITLTKKKSENRKRAETSRFRGTRPSGSQTKKEPFLCWTYRETETGKFGVELRHTN